MNGRPTIPPAPRKDEMERHGWRLTGECRKPNPNDDKEFWAPTSHQDDFEPFKSSQCAPERHPDFGERRWIVEPIPEKERMMPPPTPKEMVRRIAERVRWAHFRECARCEPKAPHACRVCIKAKLIETIESTPTGPTEER